VEDFQSSERVVNGWIFVWPGWLATRALVVGVSSVFVMMQPEPGTGSANRSRRFEQISRDDYGAPVWTVAFSRGSTHLASATVKADYGPAWYNRGSIDHELRQTEKALADYAQAVKFKPADARYWNDRGAVYQDLSKSDKALANYSKAIDLNPKLAGAWNNRGKVHLDLGQPDKALADYCNAIE
jgi:tetratricopeptide (TPR) repeat protein